LAGNLNSPNGRAALLVFHKCQETLEMIELMSENNEKMRKLKKKREQKKKNPIQGNVDMSSKSTENKNVDVDVLLQFIEGPSKSINKSKKKKPKKKINLSSESPKEQQNGSNVDINVNTHSETAEENKETGLVQKNITDSDKICDDIDDIISIIPQIKIDNKVEINGTEDIFITEDNKWNEKGKLSFSTKNKIGSGGQGTVVFSGEFDGREVAIKRLLKTKWHEADKERALLLKADDHPNIIRYFCLESDDLFFYIALELCVGNLKDLIEGKLSVAVNSLSIMKQALAGLDHLHSLQRPIIHRDIKHSNILILVPNTKDPPRAVISDLGCSKQIEALQTSFSISGNGASLCGTSGWIAPEVLNKIGEQFRSSFKMDIFSMGIVMYYTLTSGHHPFDDKHDNPLRRDVNIMDNKFNLKYLQDDKDCLSLALIKKMIAHDPNERPSASTILKHPTFWTMSKTKEFLMKVSDTLEMKDKHQLNIIEKGSDKVLPATGHNWMNALDDEVKNNLSSSQHRAYDGTKIKDLLRAIRNLSHHYHQMSSPVKLALGSLEDGFVNYWMSRFPGLLLHTYSAMMSGKSSDELENNML